MDDKSLPICWKAPKPFKSILDVKSYFKPLALVFTSAKNVQFQLQPEAYLIVTVSSPSVFIISADKYRLRKYCLIHYNRKMILSNSFQKQGNACLGILNGTEVGIGKFNVIGGKQV